MQGRKQTTEKNITAITGHAIPRLSFFLQHIPKKSAALINLGYTGVRRKKALSRLALLSLYFYEREIEKSKRGLSDAVLRALIFLNDLTKYTAAEHPSEYQSRKNTDFGLKNTTIQFMLIFSELAGIVWSRRISATKCNLCCIWAFVISHKTLSAS